MHRPTVSFSAGSDLAGGRRKMSESLSMTLYKLKDLENALLCIHSCNN